MLVETYAGMVVARFLQGAASAVVFSGPSSIYTILVLPS